MSGQALVFGVGADLSTLQPTLDSAVQMFTNFTNTIKNDVSAAFTTLFKQVKMSDALGTSVQKMRELTYIAQLTGVGTDRLAMSMRLLETNIGKAMGDAPVKNFSASLKTTTHLGHVMADAMDGTLKAAKRFESLGLNPHELGLMDTKDALMKIAVEVEKIPNTAQRYAAYRDTLGQLGRGANTIIPVLEVLGRKGADAAVEFRKLSGELTRLDYAHIELAKEAMVKLETVYQSFINQTAIQFYKWVDIGTNALLRMGVTGENSGELIGNAFRVGIDWITYLISVSQELPAVWAAALADGPSIFMKFGQQIADTLMPIITNLGIFIVKTLDDAVGNSQAGKDLKKMMAFAEQAKAATHAFFDENDPAAGKDKGDNAEALRQFERDDAIRTKKMSMMSDELLWNHDRKAYFKKYPMHDYTPPRFVGNNVVGYHGDEADKGFEGVKGVTAAEEWYKNNMFGNHPAPAPLGEGGLEGATGNAAKMLTNAIKTLAPSNLPQPGTPNFIGPMDFVGPLTAYDLAMKKIGERYAENTQIVRRLIAEEEKRAKEIERVAKERLKKAEEEAEEKRATGPLGFGGRIDQYGGSITSIINSLQRGGQNVQAVVDAEGNKSLRAIYEKLDKPATMGE